MRPELYETMLKYKKLYEDTYHMCEMIKTDSEKKLEKKESDLKMVEELYQLTIEKHNESVDEFNDKLKNKQLEFDNYKKRVELEKENLVMYKDSEFIYDIITILDDLKLSILSINDEKISFGLELICEKFIKILKSHDVVEIDALHKQFNHDLHDAVLVENSVEYPDNTILRVITPGYIYKDKIIRYSKVSVNKKDN